MHHSANGWRQLASSICKSFLPTSVHLFAKYWRQLPSSICRRFLSTSMHPSANGWQEATCMPHLQAPSSNLCASLCLCQRLEATGSTGTKHLQAIASNISAYLRQRLEATCTKRFLNDSPSLRSPPQIFRMQPAILVITQLLWAVHEQLANLTPDCIWWIWASATLWWIRAGDTAARQRQCCH